MRHPSVCLVKLRVRPAVGAVEILLENELRVGSFFMVIMDILVTIYAEYRNLKSWFKGKKYTPRSVILIANKADQWWDEQANILWQQQRLGEHKIFDPFREDLIRLQKAGIPTQRSMMATKIGWNVEPTMVDILTV